MRRVVDAVVACALGLGFAMLAPAASAAADDVVVMVDATFAATHRTEFGAGLVIAETDTQTLLVTALHVVQNEAGDMARDIAIEFAPLRGTTFKATTSLHYVDRGADLAVLFIDRTTQGALPRVLSPESRDRMSPSLPKSLSGASVSLVGAMGAGRWAADRVGAHIVSGDSSGLLIASREAQAGASGGAVFDTFGRLLAMSSRIDSGSGNLVAIPMATILARWRRWGLPVDLATARAGTSSSELTESLQRDLHVDVEFIRPDKADPQYPLGPQGPLPHRLTARLDKGLSRLAPSIEIQFSPNEERHETLILKPPAYVAETNQYPQKLVGEAWALFPDDRRLGPMPVTLDFESGPVALANSLGKKGQDMLTWIRYAMGVEQNNARISHARKIESMARYEESRVAADKLDLPKRMQVMTEAFKHWHILCKFVEATWTCDYPYPGVRGVEKAIDTIQAGTSPDDISIDVPVLPVEDFQPRLAKQTARLLATSDGVEGIYLSLKLKNGDVLGPQRLCGIERNARRGTIQCRPVP